MRKVKCPICGLYFDRDKEKNVQIKTRFYHTNCLSETSEGNRMILEEYIKDYNGARAYMRACPDVDYDSAKVTAYVILKKPEAHAYLD